MKFLRDRIPELLRVVVVIAFLVGIGLTYPLWSPSVFSAAIIPMGPIPTLIFLILFFLSLVWWAVTPRKISAFFVLVFLFVLILGDISRLRSWVYFYSILIILFTKGKSDSAYSAGPLWLFLAALYIFGGLFKVNENFFSSIAPLLAIDGIVPVFSLSYGSALMVVKLMPFAEIIVGIALLFKKTRTIGVVGTILINLVIVAVFGIATNTISPSIWPWDIAIALVAVLAFLYESREKADLSSRKYAYGFVLVVILIACIRFFESTPPPLSFAVWTGNTPNGDITITEESYQQLSAVLSSAVRRPDGMYSFSIQRAALEHTRTNIMQMRTVYVRIFKNICEGTSFPPDSSLVITHPNKKPAERIDCSYFSRGARDSFETLQK